jgi:hypothetical protein
MEVKGGSFYFRSMAMQIFSTMMNPYKHICSVAIIPHGQANKNTKMVNFRGDM